MIEIPTSVLTPDIKSQAIGASFARGCRGETYQIKWFQTGGKSEGEHQDFRKIDKVATYGILRGSDRYLKKANEYWYIDHGYFGKGNPARFNGYYRITQNAIIHGGLGDYPWDRFNKLNSGLKEWRKTGSHIVLLPPSVLMGVFLGYDADDWINRTTKKLRKHTDRKIVISKKTHNPLEKCLQDAWVVVADHSNAQTEALLNGIPVICTNDARKIGSLDQIENPPMERDYLRNLAYQQWNIKEIESGQAWGELKEHYQERELH